MSATVSATAPSSPSNGDLWFDSVNLRMYVYFNDGNSAQWVINGPSGAQGDTGAQGPAGPAGPAGATGLTGLTGPKIGRAHV